MIVQTRPSTTGGLPSTKSDELMFTNFICKFFRQVTWDIMYFYAKPESVSDVGIKWRQLNSNLFALQELESSVAVAEKVWSSQIPVFLYRLKRNTRECK